MSSAETARTSGRARGRAGAAAMRGVQRPDRPELAALRADPRRAIGPSAIVCLVCGRAFRQLTNTHLARHGLSSGEYKRVFGYNAGRALMCEELREVYRARGCAVDPAARLWRRPFRDDPACAARAARRTIRLEERLNRSAAMRAEAARRRAARPARGGTPVGPTGPGAGPLGRGLPAAAGRCKPVDLDALAAGLAARTPLTRLARALGVSTGTIRNRLRALASTGRAAP